MKRQVLLGFAFSSLVYVAHTFGAEAPPQAPKVKPMAVEKDKMKSPTVKPMSTNCFTSQTDCAGLAHFENGDASQYMGCSIFWNNGDNGQSNFTLPPNQSYDVYVRYNDTRACVWGNNAPPSDAPRYYIWVQG